MTSDDGHLFPNNFVLWSSVMVVYFQTTLDYDDGQ